MKPKVVEKTWGKELWFHNSQLYCCKHMHVNAGKACSLHYHAEKSETFVVLEGEIMLRVDDDIYELSKDDSVTIHPYQQHQFYASSCDSVIGESSTHHRESDTYRTGGREWSTESIQQLQQQG